MNKSWAVYVKEYNNRRQSAIEADYDRAELLFDIYTNEPWKDRNRYISKTAYEQTSRKTWSAIVSDELGENTLYANNTIKLMKRFGCSAYQKYGRDALLLASRLPVATGKKLITAYKNYVANAGDYTFIPAPTARSIAVGVGLIKSKFDKIGDLLVELHKLENSGAFSDAAKLLADYIDIEAVSDAVDLI